MPGDIPVTIPVVKPTIAILRVLLVHVPPPVSLRVSLNPTHTCNEPVIAAGNGSTVIIVVTKHPVVNV